MSRIFAEMQGNYGSRFLDMWRTGQALADGTDSGLRNARDLWGRKLAGFADHPERIKRALESLPQHPPTLPEFIAICRQQHADMAATLPAPKMAAEQVAPKVAAAVRAVSRRHDGDREWAKRLRAQYLARNRLLPVQISMASAALGEVWADGSCRNGATA